MAANSDGLIDHVLLKIALSSSQGLAAKEFAEEVTAFHAAEARKHHPAIEDDADILLSANPPSKTVTIDSPYLEIVWAWVTKHPDISIKDGQASGAEVIAPSTASTASAAQTDGDARSRSAFLQGMSNARLCTTEDRIWHAITDHGVDWKRLPKLEFQCLSVIAAHGPNGVLQPDVTALTGQDKRSVPKRTDMLQRKGYIIKETCTGSGAKTSLLRLKKFVSQADNGAHVQVASNTTTGPGSYKLIRYEQFFDNLISLLKQNDGLMTYEDVRKDLGVAGDRQTTRALHRCIRRLVACGMIRKLRARVDHVNPEVATRSLAKYKNDKPRWIKCLRLAREPTERDREAFQRNSRGEGPLDKSHRNLPFDADQDDVEPDEESEDEGEVDVAGAAAPDEDVAMLESVDATGPAETEWLPPRWIPDMHYSHFMYRMIESRGQGGISSMKLGEQATTRFYRKPYDEIMARLTDVWHVSQPPHLRHLAIVRDTDVQGTISHYRFRSFTNFQRAVRAKEASWDYVLNDDAVAAAVKSTPDLDAWGFPRIDPQEIHGTDGRASVTYCARSLNKGFRLQPYDPFRGKGGSYAKHANEATNLTSSMELPQEEMPQFDTTNFATPWTPNMGPPPKGSRQQQAAPFKGPSGLISVKRAEREKEQWQDRARKLAKNRVMESILAERRRKILHEGTGAVNSVVEPPRKKPRGSLRQSAKGSKDGNEAGEEVLLATHDINTSNVAKSHAERAGETSSTVATDVDAPSAAEAELAIASPQTQRRGKRKRPSEHDEPIEPTDDRVNKAYEEIVSMSKPGAYINPPGSLLTKASNFAYAIGRPRNCLIAVIKTQRLREMEWFAKETSNLHIRATARLSRSRSVFARDDTPEDATSATLRPATPTPATAPQISRVGESAMGESHGSGNSTKTVSSQNKTHAQPVRPTPLTPRKSQVGASANGGPAREVEAPLGSNVIDKSPKHPDSVDAAEDTQKPQSTPLTESDLPKETPTDVHENMDVDTSQIETNARPTPRSSDAEMIARPVVSTTGTPATDRAPIVDMSVDKSQSPSNRATNKFQNLWDMVNQPSDRASVGFKTSHPRKAGVLRSGGAVTHQRTKVILDIMEQSGGIFPGDLEIYYPFATAWRRMYRMLPDRKTLDNVLQPLLASRTLRKVTFVFAATTDGRPVTKHILIARHINPADPAVKAMQQNIAERYPATYIPQTVPLAPELRKRVDAHPFNVKRDAKERAKGNYLPTHYPLDASEVVKRVSAGPVHLGMTEEHIKASIERRTKNPTKVRTVLTRKVVRAPARQDQEIEVASQELQATMQLDSYSHDPARAHVDRGAYGKKRLGQIVRFSVVKPKPLRNPQSSVRMSRAQRAAAAAKQIGNFPALILESSIDWRASQAQMLTLTTPSQSFYERSGTFGTQSVIAVDLSRIKQTCQRADTESEPPMPSSLHDIMTQMAEQRIRKGFKAQYAEGTHTAFEHEIHLVKEWELMHVGDSPDDGLRSESPRFIVHSLPHGFVPAAEEVARQPAEPQAVALPWMPQSVQENPLQYPLLSEEPRGLVSYISTYAHAPAFGPTIFDPITESAYPEYADQAVHPAAQHFRVEPHMPIGSYACDPWSASQAAPPQHLLQGMLVPNTMNTQAALREAYDDPPQSARVSKGKVVKSKKIRRPFMTRTRRPRAKAQMPPRLAADEALSMSSVDDQRLVMAVAVVRTITAGMSPLARSINWGLVHQAFHFKFDARYIRTRWANIKGKYAPAVEKISHRFRRLFLEAYEQDEIPEIDMAYPEDTDWAELVDWADANMEPDDHDLWDLPETRDEFDEQFEFEAPERPYELDKDDYYWNLITAMRRDEMANSMTLAVRPRPDAKDDQLALLKSWVRGNVLTPFEGYDKDAAHAKLTSLGEPMLNRATDELLGEKIIKVLNKGRTLPGRNYAIADQTLSALKRPWDVNRFSEAAAFKLALDGAFRHDGSFKVPFHGPDAHTMVVQNLWAQGQITLLPLLPETVHDFDAPFPKLTKWGFTEGNYKTMHMDRDRLQWHVELRPTEEYTYGNPLNQVPIPLVHYVAGESGARLPFWTDIHGSLIENECKTVLLSMLYLLAIRPGLTISGIVKAQKNKLWAWEIEMMLKWAEETGVAQKTGVDGEEAGWTAGEWWWMAFADY